jgi:hypothetical protein
MKNYIITLSLVAMISVLGFAQSTTNQSSPPPGREVTISQQLAILNAGKDNPDNAQPLTRDARMANLVVASEADFGTANDRAAPLVQEEIRKPENTAGQKSADVQSIPGSSEKTQPEGTKPGNMIDYKNMNTGNSQSQPVEPTSVLNYKGINSGHEQPEGKVPVKEL